MKNKRTVLIVDDISDNLNVAANILIRKDINILLAQSGKEAITTANKLLPDLILLDIMMPEMDGFEVCEILKANPKTKEIPIIFLTAKNEKESIAKGFKLGAVDYITKPFFDIELLARVQTHVNLKKTITELGKKNADITASIEYAKKIQKAILPTEQFLSHFLPSNFIFYEPRDIVSGDFYWIKQIQNQIFIAVADCTGHGVPGAFMSMLGIAYLNEIVYNSKEDVEIKADEVLNLLRKRIKTSLHQESKNATVSDGMDMALCIINLDNKVMQYAGANNPLFLIRENEDTGSFELQHHKASKMPIAVHIKEKPFTNNYINLESNDLIYLFSDGFVDQFGGEKKRKFLTKNFKQLLLDNCHKPMTEQREVIADTFSNWKGENRQIDDVLIVGFKVLESYGDIEYF